MIQARDSVQRGTEYHLDRIMPILSIVNHFSFLGDCSMLKCHRMHIKNLMQKLKVCLFVFKETLIIGESKNITLILRTFCRLF